MGVCLFIFIFQKHTCSQTEPGVARDAGANTENAINISPRKIGAQMANVKPVRG